MPNGKSLAQAGKLDPDILYSGDNGRIFCGRLACAGMTAFYDGRTLAGQRVKPVSAKIEAEFKAANLPLRCEGCGR